MTDEQFTPKDKIHMMAEKYGINTHASNTGAILGRLVRKREEMNNGEEEELEKIAKELGVENLIE